MIGNNETLTSSIEAASFANLQDTFKLNEAIGNILSNFCQIFVKFIKTFQNFCQRTVLGFYELSALCLNRRPPFKYFLFIIFISY